ncbi:hypothetical protein D3C78_1615770 [compost metagenome]
MRYNQLTDSCCRSSLGRLYRRAMAKLMRLLLKARFEGCLMNEQICVSSELSYIVTRLRVSQNRYNPAPLNWTCYIT